MRVLYLPLLAAAALPAFGRWLARRVPPRTAAWSLAACCVLVAATSVWSAVVLAATLIEDLGPATGYADTEPVSDVEAAAGLVFLLTAAVGVVRTIVRGRRYRRRVDAALRGQPGALVVLPEDQPYAFSLPGRPGRIVVSRGMLRALSGSQRRVLLAHERAHLRFGHHVFRTAVDVAGAVNPLMLPVRPVMAYLCERWADEYASAAVRDRHLSARSLAAAALAGGTTSPARLGFHELGVVERVRALLAPLPAGRPVLIVALTAAVIASMVAADVGATMDLLGFLTRLGG